MPKSGMQMLLLPVFGMTVNVLATVLVQEENWAEVFGALALAGASRRRDWLLPMPTVSGDAVLTTAFFG